MTKLHNHENPLLRFKILLVPWSAHLKRSKVPGDGVMLVDVRRILNNVPLQMLDGPVSKTSADVGWVYNLYTIGATSDCCASVILCSRYVTSLRHLCHLQMTSDYCNTPTQIIALIACVLTVLCSFSICYLSWATIKSLCFLHLRKKQWFNDIHISTSSETNQRIGRPAEVTGRESSVRSRWDMLNINVSYEWQRWHLSRTNKFPVRGKYCRQTLVVSLAHTVHIRIALIPNNLLAIVVSEMFDK